MGIQARVRTRQAGSVAIIFSVCLLFIIGMFALALDLARLYNRKVDLQSVADVAALAAAQKLVGSSKGVDAAVAAAAEAATGQKYNYNRHVVAWREQALEFSDSPTAGWRDAGAARAAPGRVLFVRVDTSKLDSNVGTIATMFLRALSGSAAAHTRAVAVAGRPTLNVTPLAVCAMSPLPGAPRPATGELVEYGFRRGVAYDLMQLNSVPGDKTAASFTISPMGGSGGSPSDTSVPTVAPFICSGSMPGFGLVNETISVSRPFKLGALHEHLNSRFGVYPSGACDFRAAPPDYNVREYKHAGGAPWMKVAPSRQDAQPAEVLSRMSTIAELDNPGTDPAPLGPLWSYAQPVPFSAWMPGVPEPDGGYATFASSTWQNLYGQARPQPHQYPSETPYKSFKFSYYTPPSDAFAAPIADRRVLNVPLLSCPVSGSTATVLAIGRFFMTVRASATSLSAEFGGVASEQHLRGPVELYK